LAYVRKVVAGGAPREQAEVQAEAIKEEVSLPVSVCDKDHYGTLGFYREGFT
jgi:hypothetical protein